jgi:hypothetical protein
MPWSGGSFTRTNGVNTGSTLWAQDRDEGYKILASHHDTHDQDIADGVNSTLEKSGSNAATGNLDIGSNRVTTMADGTAKQDAATLNQIVSNGPAYAADTGTANTAVVALSPAITAYAAGQRVTFKSNAASTGATTLNVNALGAKTIKKQNDQDIASGDIESGSIVTAVYDGTNFQMTSQLASAASTAPGGSDTQVQYNSSSAFAGSANLTFDGSTLTVTGAADVSGVATAATFEPDGDTAAADNAAIGYTSAEGLILTGQGSTNDVTIKNDADEDVIEIPTGTTNVTIAGDLTVSGSAPSPITDQFFVRGAAQANVTGDGTDYTVVFTSDEIYDAGGVFTTSTYTASAAGKANLFCLLEIGPFASDHDRMIVRFVTSNRTYVVQDIDPYNLVGGGGSGGYLRLATSVIGADMDASDTCTVTVYVGGGDKVLDLSDAANILFTGYLIKN